MKHKHRIIPGYEGGEYTEGNVVVLTLVQHTMWHYAEWTRKHNIEDQVAYKMLSGQIGREEVISAKCSMGGKASVGQMRTHPNTRKAMGGNYETMRLHPNTARARVENNKKRSKVVLCVETGRIYSSVHEAMRQTGVDNGSISRSCRKGCKGGGFHWQYTQEEI